MLIITEGYNTYRIRLKRKTDTVSNCNTPTRQIIDPIFQDRMITEGDRSCISKQPQPHSDIVFLSCFFHSVSLFFQRPYVVLIGTEQLFNRSIIA